MSRHLIVGFIKPDRLGVTIPNHRNHRFILLPLPALPLSISFRGHEITMSDQRSECDCDYARSRFRAHFDDDKLPCLAAGKTFPRAKCTHGGKPQVPFRTIFTGIIKHQFVLTSPSKMPLLIHRCTWPVIQKLQPWIIAQVTLACDCQVAVRPKRQCVNASKRLTLGANVHGLSFGEVSGGDGRYASTATIPRA